MTTSNRTVPATPAVAAASGVLIALSTALGPVAHAEVPPSYGYEFVTVGDPGNRPSNASEDNFGLNRQLGAIDYTYRMARTEVTVAQWLEFVDAYAPYYEHPFGGSVALRTFRSDQINSFFFDPEPFPPLRISPGVDPNEAVTVGWEYAARYANWLHNDKNPEQWAFESGAYDTSTFGFDDEGYLTHQLEPSPGAKYWIPSRDEWIKAAHWDPNKNGPGEGGYWQYPTSTDTPTTHSLLPEDGGERNAGPDELFPLPVGSFPHIQSPWGLLDAAGGQAEWTSTQANKNQAYGEGSEWGRYYLPGSDSTSPDRLGFAGLGGNVATNTTGFRLASAVPSPGPVVLLAGLLVIPSRRRQ
jgi:formylglycine-generating enzyme required for sulfatase activity